MTKQDAPIIGITTYGRDAGGDFHLPGAYVDSVRKAGGLPVLLAPGEQRLAQTLALVDGLIFAGGGDIAPQYYDGQTHEAISRVDDERDAFELALAKAALGTDLPMLGICRGSQLLTVASGGRLIVHIPDAYDGHINHLSDSGESTTHAVQIAGESRLQAILKSRDVQVVSKHHQGLADPPQDWQEAARAADGVVEALEHRRHPWCFAVLWHPELAPEDEVQQRLFRALVRQAAEHRTR